MKTPIQLSDHFTYRRLFRFTLPSIASMIFALYTASWTATLSPTMRGRSPLPD